MFFLFVMLFVYSCDSKKQLTYTNTININDTIVAPNNCLVVAEIVEILPFVDKEDGELCSKVPCNAIVNIDKVIAYGSSFPVVLSSKKQLIVNFKHSLKATKEIEEKTNYLLPGLKKGNKFKANIEAIEQVGELKIKYTIYYYQKL
ncbi:MAG: hypothetical protein DRJ10_10110 [Bacteroidetes bacterium]|nr:MAG: hypothetical protein DRJ10_10110 [Bacteroidota bacterium]